MEQWLGTWLPWSHHLAMLLCVLECNMSNENKMQLPIIMNLKRYMCFFPLRLLIFHFLGRSYIWLHNFIYLFLRIKGKLYKDHLDFQIVALRPVPWFFLFVCKIGSLWLVTQFYYKRGRLYWWHKDSSKKLKSYIHTFSSAPPENSSRIITISILDCIWLSLTNDTPSLYHRL